MEFSNYIKELLFFNDCVILPGFGGFISKYKPATFDPSLRSFIPPSKEIVFNSNLIHNDGLFINYVAVVNRLHYRDAKEIYINFVNNLFQQLTSGNSVVFNEIGTFIFDINKNISFEVNTNTNLLAEAYGLSSFSFPIIDQIDIPQQIEQEIRDSGKIKKFLLHPLSKAAIISVPLIASLTFLTLKTDLANTLKEKYFSVNEFFADTLKNFRTFTNKEVLNNPNSMEASLALQTNKYFALFYSEPSKGTNAKSEIKIVKPLPSNVSTTKAEIKNIPEQELINATEPTKDQSKPKIKKEQKKNNETEIKISATQNKFYLIAGSFGNITNAKNLSKKIDEKGYHTDILIQKNGLYRVAVKSFADRNTAAGELSAINAKNTDFSVWILGGN